MSNLMDRRSTGWPLGSVRRYTSFVIHRTFALVALPIAAALASIGCGGGVSPVEQFARSQAAVRAAEEAGADRLDPQAQLYIKLAREQLEKGKQQMDVEAYEKADRLLRKAEADAELARHIAHLRTAEAEAEEAQQILKQIKPVN